MLIDMLDFKPVPEYSHNSIHTFGLFFNQAKELFKIVELENDERETLLDKVRDTLNPYISQTIRNIGSKENVSRFLQDVLMEEGGKKLNFSIIAKKKLNNCSEEVYNNVKSLLEDVNIDFSKSDLMKRKKASSSLRR